MIATLAQSLRTFASVSRVIAFIAVAIGTCAAAHARQASDPIRPPQVSGALSADTVELGDSLVYQLTLDGVSSADPPAIPATKGLRIDYIGGHDESSRSIMTINGRTTERSVLRYIMQWRITPERVGPNAIDSFEFEAGGHKVRAPRAEFRVIEALPNPNFRLTLESDATAAYVGEPIRMRLEWLLGANVRSASFSGPDGGTEFDVAALDPRPIQNRSRQLQQNEPFRAVPFLNGEAIITQSQGELDGRQVTKFTMLLIVTPREPGKLRVGPFRVAIDEVVGQRGRSLFDSFFDDMSRTKRSVITSNAVTLDVKPLPDAGKPSDFGGLVGVFSLAAKAGNTEANVGDPVPLMLTITGPEPLDSVKPPDLDLQTDFAAKFKPAPEGWEAATGVAAAPGERIFQTTVRPKSADVTAIPPIRLPYFDTKSGTYAVATSKPIPLTVRAAKEFTAADALRAGGASGLVLPSKTPSTLTSTAPGVRANSESLDALRDQRVALLGSVATPTGAAILLLPPACAAFAWALVWRSAKRDPEKAKRKAAIVAARRALARAHTVPELLAALRTALSPFVGAEAGAVASSDAQRPGLPEPVAREARTLLQELESAEFRGATIDPDSIRRRASQLLGGLNS